MENIKIELTNSSGRHIWKSGMEYYREKMILSGYPYYEINAVGNVYYLWELDLDDADHGTYHLIKESDDFRSLHEEGLALDEALGKKYEELNLYYTKGKELIEKLKSTK